MVWSTIQLKMRKSLDHPFMKLNISVYIIATYHMSTSIKFRIYKIWVRTIITYSFEIRSETDQWKWDSWDLLLVTLYERLWVYEKSLRLPRYRKLDQIEALRIERPPRQFENLINAKAMVWRLNVLVSRYHQRQKIEKLDRGLFVLNYELRTA